MGGSGLVQRDRRIATYRHIPAPHRTGEGQTLQDLLIPSRGPKPGVLVSIDGLGPLR